MVGGRGGTDVGESACLYDRRLAGMDTGVTRLCDSPLAAGRLVVAGFVVGVVVVVVAVVVVVFVFVVAQRRLGVCQVPPAMV